MPVDAAWTIKQGDTQPAFADTLAYSDGTVPPLHGATVVFQLRSLTNATLSTLTGSVEVLDPNTGEVLFVPSATDTATAGNYFAEWVVTFALSTGLGTQTFPTDGFNWVAIEPNLALQPQQIVSLPVIRRYLNISDGSRDSELMSLIDDIAPLVEAEVGPIIPKTYEEWHTGGSSSVTLNHDPSLGFGSNPYLQIVAASEYRGPIEYPLALVPSPAFGSIYSVMLVKDYASLTRRSAGGATIAFMPGKETVHVWYQAGQNPIPGVIQRCAMEFVRTLYRYPQQIGSGSLSPADRMELGAQFQGELSRIVRTWAKPMRRYPSLA